MTVENRLDSAGQKPGKEERKIQAAREKVLDQIFGDPDPRKGSGFSDPAAMFM